MASFSSVVDTKIGSGGTVLAREPQPRQELNLTPVRRTPSFFDPDCWDGAREKLECRIIPDETSGEPAGEPSRPAQAHRPTKEQAETLVRSLVALDIPVPTPSVGPDPSVNEWNMAGVGYALWLWTDTPASMDSTVTGLRGHDHHARPAGRHDLRVGELQALVVR